MKIKNLISKRYLILFILLILLASVFSIVYFQKSKKVSIQSNAPVVTQTNELLQFTSNNHVIGFSSDSVYIAAPTHMMKVNFVNSNNVTPVSESSNTDKNKINTLSKVTYKNIWNGIDVIYESKGDSLMKSTYIIDKKNSPDNIKIKYNRPVSLDKNNNLVIFYDIGTITESAPIAWQEINNTKVPVPVSFKINENQEVGFLLGYFDPNYPIIIDPTYITN